MLAQRATGFLIQFLDLGGDGIARDHAHGFGHAEGKALGQTQQSLVPAHGQQGFKLGGDLAVNEMLKATADLFGHLFAGIFINKRLDRRTGRLGPFDQLSHRMGAPHQAALFGEIHLCIGGVVKTIRPQMEFRFQRLIGRLLQGPRLVAGCRRILPEPESFKTANKFALYRHFAFVIHLGHEGLLLLQPPHQNACAAVNKSLCQSQMQRIRQAVFYRARLVFPMAFVFDPAFALRNIGPCADIGQAFGQCIYVTDRFIYTVNGFFQPVRRHFSAAQTPPAQKVKNPRQQ